jgi:hypothetical protein
LTDAAKNLASNIYHIGTNAATYAGKKSLYTSKSTQPSTKSYIQPQRKAFVAQQQRKTAKRNGKAG